MKPHDGPCDPDQPYLDEDGQPAFCCKVKSLQFSPAINARTRGYKGTAAVADPSWEKGVAGEHRPGGGFMPYLDSNTGSTIGVKQAAEDKREIKRIRDRQKSDPTVFAH